MSDLLSSYWSESFYVQWSRWPRLRPWPKCQAPGSALLCRVRAHPSASWVLTGTAHSPWSRPARACTWISGTPVAPTEAQPRACRALQGRVRRRVLVRARCIGAQAETPVSRSLYYLLPLPLKARSSITRPLQIAPPVGGKALAALGASWRPEDLGKRKLSFFVDCVTWGKAIDLSKRQFNL